MREIVVAAFGRADEADLVDRIGASGDAALSLVAEAGGDLVGHVLFSVMREPERCLGMAPVAVAPTHQRRGVGSALIRAGLERARRDKWRGVFVLGDPDYYQRFGFSVGAAQGFSSAFAGPHFMFLPLEAAAPREGRARYAAAFGD